MKISMATMKIFEISGERKLWKLAKAEKKKKKEKRNSTTGNNEENIEVSLISSK
jgi:hypothetical protein